MLNPDYVTGLVGKLHVGQGLTERRQIP